MRHKARISVRRIGHGRSLEESRQTRAVGAQAQKQAGRGESQGWGSKEACGGMGVCRDGREDLNS